jgi:Peptidase family M28
VRSSALVVAAALVALTVAGCLEDEPADEARPASAPFIERLAADVPPLEWDGEAAIAWWEDFVTTYPKRDTYLPNNDPATRHIADALEALGLEVQQMDYPARAPLAGNPLPGQVPLAIHTVVAFKAGLTQPDHAIALGAHYDTQTATLQGAFDNGSGTAMVFDLCKQLSQVPMDKSLLCLFFDGEEQGALGSQAYLEDPPEGSPAIDVYLGYDMVGMNWPGYQAWKAYTWVGDEFAAELFPLANETVHGVLGFPDGGAEVFDFNDRNSDEAIFAEAGIPTLRFAGGRRAGDYDQYHMPDDTVDHVYDVVGGRQNYIDGFGALVLESYTLALMLDGTSLAELQAEYA